MGVVFLFTEAIMDPIEKKEFEKLLGKDYIQRGVKRQVIKDKDGKKIPIIDMQKATGLDEQGGITDAELDNIHEYDCQCVSEGRANYGGKCAICKNTFCNKILNGRPTCYRKCLWCHRKICMAHVRGERGSPVYCSFKCFLSANPAIILLFLAGGLVIFFVLKAVFH